MKDGGAEPRHDAAKRADELACGARLDQQLRAREAAAHDGRDEEKSPPEPRPLLPGEERGRGVEAVVELALGMGVHVGGLGVGGAVRATLVVPGDDEVASRVPTTGDPAGFYSTNIQICELNALNASLAVVAWKRHFGFYANDRAGRNSVFVVDGGRLHVEAGGSLRCRAGAGR